MVTVGWIRYFLTDDQLASLMQQLHAFCAPGSSMAMSFPAATDGSDPEQTARTLAEVVRVAGIDFYHRTAERIAELVKPWRMTQAEPLEAWLDADLPSVDGPDPLHHVEMMGPLRITNERAQARSREPRPHAAAPAIIATWCTSSTAGRRPSGPDARLTRTVAARWRGRWSSGRTTQAIKLSELAAELEERA